MHLCERYGPRRAKSSKLLTKPSGVLAAKEQKEKDVSMMKMRPKALVEIEGGSCFR